MGFSKNLKREIEYSGMGLRDIAAKSGMKLHSLNNYLGSRNQIPSVIRGAKIAKALGVTVEQLVFGEDSKVNADLRAINSLSRQLTDSQKKFLLKIIKIYLQEKS